ncbi:GNAT family N-acetyltransferase [Sphingobacterium multivorum]|uniref:GNAT family N-acetyltransferase n=2 Tax=Sphingobacterium multivorum TaxID=28454 RepID=UPI000E99695B|nr:hypothetical protein [Sphingobacterium sp.]HBI89135.1 hypothetical protein [Sphingobacterium sp.]
MNMAILILDMASFIPKLKGYAKEAALGLIEWAFKQAGVKAITANCSEENFASQKILTFLNFNVVKEYEGMIYWKLLSTN